MNAKMLKAMRPKKKRTMDPDIPRPNLFTHEKRLKDMQAVNDMAMDTIKRLQSRVHKLEAKISGQTSYLQALHRKMQGKG